MALSGEALTTVCENDTDIKLGHIAISSDEAAEDKEVYQELTQLDDSRLRPGTITGFPYYPYRSSEGLIPGVIDGFPDTRNKWGYYR